MPLEIVEKDAIKELVQKGLVVVGVGGGGIPVIRNEEGNLKGVAAVIDKDASSSLLASEICADLFVISTTVGKVYINFGKANQEALDRITVAEARKYIEQGEFAKGSMLPKIQAIVRFLEAGGKEAIVTNPESIENALGDEAGTHIVP
jgi:carbamate kinase